MSILSFDDRSHNPATQIMSLYCHRTAEVVIQLPGSCLYTVIWRQKSSSRGWGALTHFYFLSSLKRRFICFMITSVPSSMIISVIKWSSVKIYVWSAFFFWCLYNTLAEKVYFPLLFLFINSRLIGLSIRNGLAEHSEEQAKKSSENLSEQWNSAKQNMHGWPPEWARVFWRLFLTFMYI
jgi:hypothetical protein